MLVASMLATAVALARIEFLTAALVAGVAGIGTDVRLTQEIAVAR